MEFQIQPDRKMVANQQTAGEGSGDGWINPIRKKEHMKLRNYHWFMEELT